MKTEALLKLEQSIGELKKEFISKIESGAQKVDSIRVEYMGKKGRLTSLLETLVSLPKEEKPEGGKLVTGFRTFISEKIEELKKNAQSSNISKLLSDSCVDVSLPVDSNKGSLHPIMHMKQEIIEAFHKLGFSYCDGPEVDFDFYNFQALNFSPDHPARDMQDTFFVDDKSASEPVLLRTHTSNIQIHTMLDRTPPIKIFAPGRTFRCDSDVTHTPMFHQVEALMIDQAISFADMKGIILWFLREIFGQDVTIRLRPSYFPFVEPGGEVDMRCVRCKGEGCNICKGTGWLEIAGCGMVHPNVLEAVGYDSERYMGFAFGFGIDRMAMLKYDISDSRMFYEGDKNFLSQFPIFLK